MVVIWKAKKMAAIALMWPMLPTNQWIQLNTQRFSASHSGLKTAPIGFTTATTNATRPNIWCGPYSLTVQMLAQDVDFNQTYNTYKYKCFCVEEDAYGTNSYENKGCQHARSVNLPKQRLEFIISMVGVDSHLLQTRCVHQTWNGTTTVA